MPLSGHLGLRRRRPAAEQHGCALRRFPAFPVFGRGDYLVQPIYAEDVAALLVDAGSLTESHVVDDAGPETFNFGELLRLLAEAVGGGVRLVHTPPSLALMLGLLLRHMVLTRDGINGLMDGLLTSGGAPTGTAWLGAWLGENGRS